MGCQIRPSKEQLPGLLRKNLFLTYHVLTLGTDSSERGQGPERQAHLLMPLGFGDEEGKRHKPLMGALKKTQRPVKNKETALGIGTEAGPREAHWGMGGEIAGGGGKGRAPYPPQGGKN